MSPPQAILLSILLTLVAGECDVYNTQSNVGRCREVQDCVNAAFFSNRNNRYVLDKIFRSTERRPPIALLVNYTVMSINNNLNGNGSGEYYDEGSRDRNNATTTVPEDDGNKVKIIVQYNKQLGWTTSGIYTAISPVFLVSLLPKMFITTMSFYINENFNLPKSIHLELRLENLPKDTTPSEVKEALEYLTMNLNYNSTGRTAYIWNTDTSSLQYAEIILLIIMVLLASLTLALVMVIAIVVTTDFKRDNAKILLAFLIFHVLSALINLAKEFTWEPLYLPQYSLSLIILSVINLSSWIFGLPLLCCCGKKSQMCTKIIIVIYTGGFCPLAVSLGAFSAPLFIEAFIFPTEIISIAGVYVISFVQFYPIHIVLKWLKRNFNIKGKLYADLIKLICGLILFTTINLAVYMYLAIVRRVFESPIDQISRILFAFTPTILAVIGTHLLEKKLGSQKKSNPKTENTEHDGDDAINNNEEESQQNQAMEQTDEQSDQPTNDTTTNDNDEENQETENGESRSDDQSDGGASQESGFQKRSVVVEVHQDNSSDGQYCESTI